mmetsp:Transcript_52185/g.111090  ORF Transcript_52185/g.111090 Transcript_52185/m.111090 type:complete len:288 (-) Transcript_52185:728-1591(-)
MFRRGVKLDVRQFGEVSLQDLPGILHHDLSTVPSGHASQDQYIFDVQVLAILGNSVAEVNPDALVDLGNLWLFLWVLHGGLDFLEALGVGDVACCVHVGVFGHHLLGKVHTTFLGQPSRRALTQVHRSVSPVGGPHVGRSLRVQIERVVGVLVDPASQVSVLVDIARSFAASKGDTEEATLADHLTSSDGGNLAVVDDLDGDTPELVLGDVVEDRDNLLLVDIGGDIREAIAPSGLAIRRNGARGRATDGFQSTRELGCRVFHGLDDDVVVVLRVGVSNIPLSLGGI